jgi:biopolymer transport protein TolR
MLVLLGIFMVTAPMLTQGGKVELPETTSDPIQAEKDTESVVVSIDANGAYYLQVGDEGSDPMPLGRVQEMVSRIMAERTNREVLVRGDDNVQYGKVVRLMSALQQAGATNVGLITEAEKTDDAGG